MDCVLPVLIFVGVLFAIASWNWHHTRGRQLLSAWAEREDLTLLSAEECWLWRGPFWWRSGQGNAVYRVVVRDARGRTREGYVRCGGLYLGMWSDQVEVVWDR